MKTRLLRKCLVIIIAAALSLGSIPVFADEADMAGDALSSELVDPQEELPDGTEETGAASIENTDAQENEDVSGITNEQEETSDSDSSGSGMQQENDSDGDNEVENENDQDYDTDTDVGGQDTTDLTEESEETEKSEESEKEESEESEIPEEQTDQTDVEYDTAENENNAEDTVNDQESVNVQDTENLVNEQDTENNAGEQPDQTEPNGETEKIDGEPIEKEVLPETELMIEQEAVTEQDTATEQENTAKVPESEELTALAEEERYSVEAFNANLFPPELYLQQPWGEGTCTLYAATMMIRAKMYVAGHPDWASVTADKVKAVAWNNGLNGTFTYWYDSSTYVTVTCTTVWGLSAQAARDWLDPRPEGVVAYDQENEHAIFLTDYVGDTFYCSDSGNYNSGYERSRIPVSHSILGINFFANDQLQVLAAIDKVWYVSDYNINVNTSGYLDVGGLLDCESSWGTEGYGTFDVYLNGSLVADDVSDYAAPIPAGTNYEIKDVKPLSGKYYFGAYDGNISGTIINNQTTIVWLRFVTILSGEQLISNGRYQIATVLDETKVLNVENGGTALGTNLILYTNLQQTCQIFDVYYNSEGYYTFQAVHSGNYIHVGNAMETTASNVVTWEYTGLNARWVLINAGNGYYDIVQSYGGKYLDVSGGNTVDGTNIIVCCPDGSDAQRYKFIPVSVSITNASVSGVTDKDYTGSAVTQSPTVKINGMTLQQEVDYTVSYSNNVNAGTATMTITGKNGYTGSVSKTFKIGEKITKYDVKYDANGGSGAPSAQTKTSGQTLTLSSTKPTRTGYDFINWNTKKDGTGTSYAPGASYTADASVTLYSIWQLQGGFHNVDGVWGYYQDGNLQSSMTGMVKGTINGQTAWYYIKNGIYTEATGITKKTDDSSNKWYFVKNGKYTKATGIARRADKSNSKWYYVKNGVYTKATGIAKRADGSNNKWYYVKKGVYTKATGIAKKADGSSSKWYFVKNGVYTKATGLAKKADGSSKTWFYVKNGVYKKATTIAKKAGSSSKTKYYVKAGKLNKYTGTVKIGSKKYELVKGVVKKVTK